MVSKECSSLPKNLVLFTAKTNPKKKSVPDDQDYQFPPTFSLVTFRFLVGENTKIFQEFQILSLSTVKKRKFLLTQDFSQTPPMMTPTTSWESPIKCS